MAESKSITDNTTFFEGGKENGQQMGRIIQRSEGCAK